MITLKRMVLFVLGAIGVICSGVVLTGALVMLLPPLVLVGMIFVGVTVGIVSNLYDMYLSPKKAKELKNERTN
jgi:hypothetical protein